MHLWDLALFHLCIRSLRYLWHNRLFLLSEQLDFCGFLAHLYCFSPHEVVTLANLLRVYFNRLLRCCQFSVNHLILNVQFLIVFIWLQKLDLWRNYFVLLCLLDFGLHVRHSLCQELLGRLQFVILLLSCLPIVCCRDFYLFCWFWGFNIVSLLQLLVGFGFSTNHMRLFRTQLASTAWSLATLVIWGGFLFGWIAFQFRYIILLYRAATFLLFCLRVGYDLCNRDLISIIWCLQDLFWQFGSYFFVELIHS